MFNECEIGIKSLCGRNLREGDRILLLQSDWPSKCDSDSRTLDEYLDDRSIYGQIRYFPELASFRLANRDGEERCSLYAGRHGRIKYVAALDKTKGQW